MSLQNKITLITGASRGIGQAISYAIGQAGSIVIGTATTIKGANQITQLFSEHHIQGEGMVLDVCNAESIEALLDHVQTKFGQINILINNAAITRDNLLLRMKDDEWFQVIDTNLHAIYRLSKACIRDMIKARWGRIINIGSVIGTVGNPGQANYAAAKAGIVGFSKALAIEVGSRGITVNTIAPGFIETDMTRSLSEEQRNTIFERIPMKRLGHVNDVASAAVFLASPNAGYITGQTLHVNGGMYMG